MAISLIVLWYNENQGKSPRRISSVLDEVCFSKRAMEKISVVQMQGRRQQLAGQDTN